MPIIRHRYTKLEANLSKTNQAKVEINSSIRFTDVVRQETMKGDSSDGYLVSYDFKTSYGSDGSVVHIVGDVLYIAAKKEAREIEDTWEKEKVLPQATVLVLGNYCLMRAQMKAIGLANDLEIQSPVRLPAFEAKSKE